MVLDVQLAIRMESDELELLLYTSNTSYRFILHLAELAKDSSGLLPPQSIALLKTKTGSLQWIRENQGLIPGQLQPNEENFHAFSMLTRSHFLVSFHFDTMTWDGQVLDTNLNLRALPKTLLFGPTFGN